MKKTYVKPEVCFESFQLSACIANTCGNPTNTPADYSCGVSYMGMTLFLDDISACTDKVEDGFGGYCYHHPADNETLFNS